MGRFNIKLMGSVAAVALFLTPAANAMLMMQISDSANFIDEGLGTLGTQVISASDTDGDGQVMIGSGLGSWISNFSVGSSSPLIGDASVDVLDLLSYHVSGGTGNIYVRLSDTDFARTSDNYNASVGGTTNGSVSFSSYANSSNADFGKDTLLSSYIYDSSTGGADSFSNTQSGVISMAGPYSMSIYAAVTHASAGQISSFDYQIKVPEPSSLALLGLGLIGAGFAARRKGRKMASTQ